MGKHVDSILIKGKEIEVDVFNISGKDIIVKGNMFKIAKLKNEYFEDIENPEDILRNLLSNRIKADVFTFWQRLPDVEPRYKYLLEYESLAVLKIDSYEDWYNHTIDSKTRNVARKAGKKNVLIEVTEFNDEFVKGIVNIYNETPIRQGKPFWHYGKSYDKVKEETSDALDKSIFIGAYYEGKLIGFIKLLIADQYAMIVLILSMIEHRDKSTQNALIAKAVEICSNINKRYIIYAKWDVEIKLADFKRSNGFGVVNIPRYYIPITIKGNIFMKLNLQHGFSYYLPLKLKALLNEVRVKMVTRKSEM